MSKRKAIPRAAVAPFGPVDVREDRSKVAKDSDFGARSLTTYCEDALRRLDGDNEGPFLFDEYAYEAYQAFLRDARKVGYKRARNTRDASLYLGIRAREFEQEFKSKSVLDIGCGEGLIGHELKKLVGSQVTFLDVDTEVLEEIPSEWGSRVRANVGDDFDFEDESYDATLSVFSAIPWARTPLEAVQSLNEQLRVTQVGGVAVILGMFQDINERGMYYLGMREERRRGIDVESERIALATTDLKNVGLIRALSNMASQDVIGVTWFPATIYGLRDGVSVSYTSAVIDVYNHIPSGVFRDNLEGTVAGHSCYDPRTIGVG